MPHACEDSAVLLRVLYDLRGNRTPNSNTWPPAPAEPRHLGTAAPRKCSRSRTVPDSNLLPYVPPRYRSLAVRYLHQTAFCTSPYPFDMPVDEGSRKLSGRSEQFPIASPSAPAGRAVVSYGLALAFFRRSAGLRAHHTKRLRVFTRSFRTGTIRGFVIRSLKTLK